MKVHIAVMLVFSAQQADYVRNCRCLSDIADLRRLFTSFITYLEHSSIGHRKTYRVISVFVNAQQRPLSTTNQYNWISILLQIVALCGSHHAAFSDPAFSGWGSCAWRTRILLRLWAWSTAQKSGPWHSAGVPLVKTRLRVIMLPKIFKG